MCQVVSQALIEGVHASGKQLVLSITGGGSRAITSLLEVPGASNTVLGAVVPYAAAALERWLGGPVDHFCSERTARAMAMVAFERARQLSTADPYSLRGIGATASLATTRPKRGPHRVHVAWQSAERTVALSCELVKGRRTRGEEELVAAQLVIAAVLEACGLESGSLLPPDVAASAQRREQIARAAWTELLLGSRSSVMIRELPHDTAAASPSVDEPQTQVILFPGAFDPLHEGHRRMADVAAALYGRPVTYELSIANVDKPLLDFIEVSDRLAQFAGQPVLLSRAATFVEKSQLAPGCVFVVGADTVLRIGDARYYDGNDALRDAAIARIAQQGCRFLVFGRSSNGRFEALSDLDLSAPLRHLCDEVPESTFRADVSSTALRELKPGT
jgi:nicotinamide mononucleotide (NMN) deamidase PncC